MKHSEEWGNGKVVKHSLLGSFGRKTYSGGSGFVLTSPQLPGVKNTFCLKCVPLLQESEKLNEIFWNEAQSVSVYTSVVRKISGCAACPIPAQYWIHESDPLFLSFPRGEMSKERPKCLIDFISIFDIQPEQLLDKGIDPAEYWLAPRELLKTIYDSHKLAGETQKYNLPPELYNKLFASKIKCDLLLTYPIQQGKDSLDKGVLSWRESKTEDAQAKEAQEISKMIYQILSAILELYRNGVAHGDIKPANIIRRSIRRLGSGQPPENSYFLTDMGSIHAGNLESETGSGRFFNFSVFEEWKNVEPEKFNQDSIGEGGFYPENEMPPEELKSLLCRTLMDGYALALTIWSQAKGSDPTSSLVNRALVKKWQSEKIVDAFNTLYDVRNLTIEKMQEIVDWFAYDHSAGRIADDYNCIETYGRESEFPFEVKYTEVIETQVNNKTCEVSIEYGYLQEQINFSGKVNPMLRIKGNGGYSRIADTLSMKPLISSYSNGSKILHEIYHAPDDITGSRAVAWDEYKPFSLDWVLSDSKNRESLTDALYQQLLELGRKIDEKFAPDKLWFALPYPRDIVKIDNKWFIQPFFLSVCRLNREFKFEEYFKMLCGQENTLSALDWLDLLEFDKGVGILFELLPDSMVPEIIECLKSSENRNLSRKLLSTAKFKKYPEGESLPLQIDERD